MVLEDEFPFVTAYFQWQTVIFMKGTHFFIYSHFFVFLLVFILNKRPLPKKPVCHPSPPKKPAHEISRKPPHFKLDPTPEPVQGCTQFTRSNVQPRDSLLQGPMVLSRKKMPL